MSRGEERVSTFLLTGLSVGLLTESLTRFVSLMRFTPSVILAGIFGIFFLVLLLLHIGLASD